MVVVDVERRLLLATDGAAAILSGKQRIVGFRG
jgi:hypothetical protein